MKTGKALLAVLTGLVAGATLGLLFSSTGEKRSQQKMSKKKEALADLLSTRIDEKFGELEARIEGRGVPQQRIRDRVADR